MAAREVLIVLYDGVQSLDVTGPLEVFTGAADFLADRAAIAGKAYEVLTASLGGRPVTSSSGLGLASPGAAAAPQGTASGGSGRHGPTQKYGICRAYR